MTIKKPLRTETFLNYSMYFAGKVRTFDQVILTFIPSENKPLMSVAEHRRLSLIISQESLTSNEQLLIGEGHNLMYAYKHKLDDLIAKKIIEVSTPEQYKYWRKEWEQVLNLQQSAEIRKYFKSIPNHKRTVI